jgi:hypothetical protein
MAPFPGPSSLRIPVTALPPKIAAEATRNRGCFRQRRILEKWRFDNTLLATD